MLLTRFPHRLWILERLFDRILHATMVTSSGGGEEHAVLKRSDAGGRVSSSNRLAFGRSLHRIAPSGTAETEPLRRRSKCLNIRLNETGLWPPFFGGLLLFWYGCYASVVKALLHLFFHILMLINGSLFCHDQKEGSFH